MEQIEIVYMPFAKLRPDPRNSNTHPVGQVEQIAASIKQFGFNNPILIDKDGVIIAGEGRWLAAKLLARKKVPTITLSHLTEAQRRAFLVADNQIPRNSVWDAEKLSIELRDLSFAKFDLNTLGFDQSFIDSVLKQAQELTGGSKDVITVGSHTRTIKQDAPKINSKGKVRQLAVLVYCSDEADQDEVFTQLTEQGYPCKNTLV